MEVNDVKCYGLVDSGASVSLCSKNILGPANKLDTSKMTKVRGVSGNYLNVLGNTNISCKIGEFPFHLTNITVVEEMADCVFIIGRDILEPHNCIINFRDLTLQIDEHKFPLIKAYQGKHLKRPVAVHSSSTYNIPAHSSSIISCHLRSRQQGKNPKLYLTTSGAFEPCPKYNHESIVPNCLINTNRGKSHILIYNTSDHPLCIYKHKKVGNLETFHCSELSALNSVVGRHTTTPSPPLQPRHAMPDSQVNSIKDEISDISDRITKLCKNHEMHNPMVKNINTLSNLSTARVNFKTHNTPVWHGTYDTPDKHSPQDRSSMHEMHDSDNVKSVLQCNDVIHQKNKNRWATNISELYKKLGTDELTHISEAEKLQVKELISDVIFLLKEKMIWVQLT